MAASRLQRWAIILSSYDYDVKYQPSILHGNADGLSRLPLQKESLEQNDSVFVQVLKILMHIINTPCFIMYIFSYCISYQKVHWTVINT